MFSRVLSYRKKNPFIILNNSYKKNAFHTGDIVSITENAWTKIGTIITSYNKQNNALASMILSINGGGCNGFKYDLHLDTKILGDVKKYDKYSFVEKNDSRVYIDPIGEMYLLGTKIDYIKEDLNKNIFESKFIFIPDSNIATNCGCGTSFSPK
jgi:iron-sulfur cluster assembly accessory protein